MNFQGNFLDCRIFTGNQKKRFLPAKNYFFPHPQISPLYERCLSLLSLNVNEIPPHAGIPLPMMLNVAAKLSVGDLLQFEKIQGIVQGEIKIEKKIKKFILMKINLFF